MADPKIVKEIFKEMDINKKILKFAGFKAIDDKTDCWQEWERPDGSRCFAGELPDFTHPVWGIAHLFKWVVPKLPCAVHLYTRNKESRAALFDAELSFLFDENRICGHADTLALSLCYAVIKFIDSQVPSEVR